MSPRCNLKKKIPTKKKKATEFRAAHQKCSSSSNARARAPDGREAAGRTPEQEQPRGRQGKRTKLLHQQIQGLITLHLYALALLC
ncbi:hypothetical protein SORBI_3004G343733 [Sorghum bicolor]|uniref:Uncharacterized protein n=1 Tax=Sorghum bicolor TaxID=4558 RepID=A0A1Z5RQ95_SORBI|nr:hypothetical protein SORBI_3004G343733 [Sorghum bicolor]